MKNNKKAKDTKKRELSTFGIRLAGFVILLIIGVFIKFNPSGANAFLNVVFKTDCSYINMASDIGKTIKIHTVGERVFSLPHKGEITSPFGKRQRPDGEGEEEHTGIDIDAPLNTSVYAGYEGRVTRVEENEFYGKFVMIEHSPSLVTLYGHLNEQSVNIGDFVNKETVIGLSGNTGRSTGPHIHFEIRKSGKCVNPEDYIL